METKLLNNTDNDIDIAIKIIKEGGLVAIPTETVYGLAADALNGKAVSKIFKAKGRPMDNPLIVHIGDFSDIDKLVSEVPDKAYKLAKIFWPGPLTIILKKSNLIPDEVSANLETVAIRYPNHKLAIEVIRRSGKVLAAPSANISGSPSPTTAQHVYSDLNGRIDAIIDGGKCSIGIESTVITFATKTPRLLRPGGITREQIEDVIGKIEVDRAVLNEIKSSELVSSPGMKYKHYSPKAKVIIVKDKTNKYVEYINSKATINVGALCYDEDIELLKVKTYNIGKRESINTYAQNIFAQLRKVDDDNIDIVYARCPDVDGVGMAVYNRLIRASGFEVITLA